jgi:hypothetical protein
VWLDPLSDAEGPFLITELCASHLVALNGFITTSPFAYGRYLWGQSGASNIGLNTWSMQEEAACVRRVSASGARVRASTCECVEAISQICEQGRAVLAMCVLTVVAQALDFTRPHDGGGHTCASVFSLHVGSIGLTDIKQCTDPATLSLSGSFGVEA